LRCLLPSLPEWQQASLHIFQQTTRLAIADNRLLKMYYQQALVYILPEISLRKKMD
jgi:hypothetical protein